MSPGWQPCYLFILPLRSSGSDGDEIRALKYSPSGGDLGPAERFGPYVSKTLRESTTMKTKWWLASK